MDLFQQIFKDIWATEACYVLALLAFFAFSWLMLRQIKETRTGWIGLVGILLLGLGLRAAWSFWTQPEPLSDFHWYWAEALRLHHGDPTYVQLGRHPGIIVIDMLAFKLFGASLQTAFSVNLFFSAVLMLLIFSITRLLTNRATAFLAMSIAALFPQMITYNALVSTEIAAVTFAALVTWGVLHSRDIINPKHPWLYWIGLGMVLYGAVLIRSTSLLFVGVIPLTLILARRGEWRRWLTRYAVMACTLALMLSTWIYHQYLLTGQAKMFFGESLWLACNVQYDKDAGYADLRDMNIWPEIKPAYDRWAKENTIPSEIAFYDSVSRSVLKIIKADPAKYFRYSFVRMRRILWTSQTGLRWTQQGSPQLRAAWPEKIIKRIATVSNIVWEILLLLAPFGFLAWRRSPSATGREGFLLLGIFSSCWLVFHFLIAESNERYAFQIIPLVIMLAGSTIFWLWSTISNRLRQPQTGAASPVSSLPANKAAS